MVPQLDSKLFDWIRYHVRFFGKIDAVRQHRISVWDLYGCVQVYTETGWRQLKGGPPQFATRLDDVVTCVYTCKTCKVHGLSS